MASCNGQTLQVDLVTYVRDIARFESPGDLIKQLEKDIGTVRIRLANNPRSE